LVRLEFSYVMHYGFLRGSAEFVPKLFPSYEVTPRSETNSLDTVAIVKQLHGHRSGVANEAKKGLDRIKLRPKRRAPRNHAVSGPAQL
jgi:hypothetical protein